MKSKWGPGGEFEPDWYVAPLVVKVLLWMNYWSLGNLPTLLLMTKDLHLKAHHLRTLLRKGHLLRCALAGGSRQRKEGRRGGKGKLLQQARTPRWSNSSSKPTLALLTLFLGAPS